METSRRKDTAPTRYVGDGADNRAIAAHASHISPLFAAARAPLALAPARPAASVTMSSAPPSPLHEAFAQYEDKHPDQAPLDGQVDEDDESPPSLAIDAELDAPRKAAKGAPKQKRAHLDLALVEQVIVARARSRLSS